MSSTSRVEATGRVVRILGVIKIIETRQRSDSESSMQGVCDVRREKHRQYKREGRRSRHCRHNTRVYKQREVTRRSHRSDFSGERSIMVIAPHKQRNAQS